MEGQALTSANGSAVVWSREMSAPIDGHFLYHARAVDGAGNYATTEVELDVSLPRKDAVVLSPAAQPVTGKFANYLIGYDSTTGDVRFMADPEGRVFPGAVLISGVVPGIADRGFIRKVVRVVVVPGGLVAQTVAGSFAEVFRQAQVTMGIEAPEVSGPLEGRRRATPVDPDFNFDVPIEGHIAGDEEDDWEVSYELTASGGAGFEFSVGMDWDWINSRPVIHKAGVGIELGFTGEIDSTFQRPNTFQHAVEKTLWERDNLKMIEFSIGPVPVVISLEGEVEAEVTAEINENLRLKGRKVDVGLRAGVLYEHGAWGWYGNPNATANFDLDYGIEASLEAGVRAELAALFYDGIGPEFGFGPKFEASAMFDAIDLKVDVCAEASLVGTVGIDGEIPLIDVEFLDEAVELFELKILELGCKKSPFISPPNITPSALPDGLAGENYTTQLLGTGEAPLVWSVIGGELPAGLALDSDGTLHGSPRTAGRFTFRVKLADRLGQESAAYKYTLEIKNGPTIVTLALPGAQVDQPYEAELHGHSSAGGEVRWALVDGAPPPGVAWVPPNRLVGIPTRGGSFPFTVELLDEESGLSTRKVYYLHVGYPLPRVFTSYFVEHPITGITADGSLILQSQALFSTLPAGGGQYLISPQQGCSPFGRSISASGNEVVLTCYDLIAKTATGYLWNRELGSISEVAKSYGLNFSSAPMVRENFMIRGDGRTLVFSSASSSAANRDADGRVDVFERDLVSGVTRRISFGLGGAEPNGDSFQAISADNGDIVFQSTASNLTADDDNARADVFVFDARTEKITRIPFPEGVLNGEFRPGFIVPYNNLGISADGSTIACGQAPPYIFDRRIGHVSPMLNPDADFGDSPIYGVSLSGNGSRVVFAPWQIANAIYEVDRHYGIIVQLTGEGSSYYCSSWHAPVISRDGAVVATGVPCGDPN